MSGASIVDKFALLLPEIWLLVGAIVVSVMGLSRGRVFRDAVPMVVCVFLAVAMGLVPWVYADAERVSRAGLLLPGIGPYVKMMVCGMGILLAMLSVRLVDQPLEEAIATGRARFDPIRVGRVRDPLVEGFDEPGRFVTIHSVTPHDRF